MLKLLRNMKKEQWLLVILVFVLIIAQVWLELKMPDYMSEITKLVQTKGSRMQDILVNGGYMLLCTVGSLILSIIVGYYTANISANFSMNVRKRLFN